MNANHSAIANRQSKMGPRCHLPLPSGAPCSYTPAECPFHDPPAPQPEQAPLDAGDTPPDTSQSSLPPRPKIKLPAFVERRGDNVEPRKLAIQALKRALSGSAVPLQVARLVRASLAITAMGPDEMDEEDALAEAEFRGRLMHGMPPLGEAEWNYARQLFDADTVSEFARWAVMLDAPFPEDITPAGGYTRAEAREYRNTRFRQQPPPVDLDTTGEDDDDQAIIIRRGPWPGTEP